MSSDVTISAAGYSFQFTSTDLLLSCVFIVALVIILLVAFSYTRRAALRSAEAADVLIVQMERIGDSLERLVAQNAHNALMAQSAAAPAASAPAQLPDYPPRPQRPAADWAAVERVAKENAPPPAHPTSRPSAHQTRHAPAAQQAAAPASSTPPAKSPKPGAESGEIGPVSEHVRSLLHSMLGK
jgi:type IV secretory pathway VirB10-like protein